MKYTINPATTQSLPTSNNYSLVRASRKLLRSSYWEHKINNWVQSNINLLVGPQEPLLAIVKGWKLSRFECVMRHDSL